MDEYCEDDRDVILDMGEAAQHKGSQRSTSGTTGSPKLPLFEDMWNAIRPHGGFGMDSSADGLAFRACQKAYDYIERQLQLPDLEMENVRCLELFIAHRACLGAPAWSAWSEVKKFIVAVRQQRKLVGVAEDV